MRPPKRRKKKKKEKKKTPPVGSATGHAQCGGRFRVRVPLAAFSERPRGPARRAAASSSRFGGGGARRTGQGRPLGAGLSARPCGGGPAARRRGHFPQPHAVETRGAVLCAAERKPAFPARTGGRLPGAELRRQAAGRRCQLGSEAAAFPTAKLKGTVFPAHSTREKSYFLITIPSPFPSAQVQRKEYNRIFPTPQTQIGLSRYRATMKVNACTREDLHLRDVGTRGAVSCLFLTPPSHRARAGAGAAL